MKDVQCYELFGGIALKNHAFFLRRGQGRTWTLAKDLLNDLSAIDCNIDDIIKLCSSLFTRLAYWTIG